MKDFTLKILEWYAGNKRKLPWRDSSDPYKIWLSEIILQQTRVDQGMAYYLRFVEAFPAVEHLAEASEEKVLKLWQGLGYYSRARNLHATARQLVKEYGGRFPGNYDELINLKGIGPYTAAAIASIAFGQVVPVIDGNVIRVLARYHGIREAYGNAAQRKIFEKYARDAVSPEDPGNYNQAIMEFGALHCMPVKPDCQNCIFRKKCFAFRENLVGQLPLRTAKTRVRQRYFNYLVFRYRGNNSEEIYLRKRNANDIWKNLYDFPLIESDSFLKTKEIENRARDLAGQEITSVKKSGEYQHLLTHRKIKARFYIFDLDRPLHEPGPFLRLQLEKLNELPVPRLIEKFLRKEKFL